MQDGCSALICAADEGHLQIVQELLKHGANVQVQNKVMWGTVS